MKEDSAMNTLVPIPASQEITRSRRIGVVIYPDCDIVDVCGPCDVFHYSDYYLRRFGRTNEPGYKCDILAATPGPVRTSCGIEIVATHSFCDLRDSLDTLVVAGGVAAEQVSKDEPGGGERNFPAEIFFDQGQGEINPRGDPARSVDIPVAREEEAGINLYRRVCCRE